MKRLLKISGKILGWLLLGTILLVVVLALVLQLPVSKNILRNQAQKIANDALLGTIEIGRIEGTLFTSARLRDVTLKNERGDLVAYIPHARAHYGLLGAIRGQLTVDRVEVDRPLAIVRVYEDGSFNFETIAKPSEPDGPPGTFEVFLDNIQIKDGLVLYADESGSPTEHSAEQLSKLRAVFQDSAALQGDLQALTDRVQKFIAPDPSAETSPTDTPIMASAAALQLDASFALLSQQQITFHVERFDTDAHLDTLPLTLPLRTRNLRGFYEPAALNVRLENLALGHNTGLNDLHINARFHTSTDAFGSRSTTTPEQLAVKLASLRIGQSLANLFTPQQPLLTDLELDFQASGNLQDLWFLANLSPDNADKSSANRITAAGHLDLGTLADSESDQPPSYLITLAAHGIAPDQLIQIDALDNLQLSARLNNATILLEGEGADLSDLVAEASVALDSMEIQRGKGQGQSETFQLDTLYLTANYADGYATLPRLGLLTPYIDAFASGLFDPSGTFSAELRTTADTKQTAQASTLSKSFLKARPTQADLRVELTGLFDPDIRPVQDALQNAQLTAAWDFQKFQAESIQINLSNGSLNAGVHRRGSSQNPVYQADFRLRTENRGLQADDARVATLSARASGKAALALPIEQPLAALQNLSANVQLTTSGLQLDRQTRLDAATIHADLNQRPGQTASFAYSFHTTSSGLQAAGNRIETLAADLQGQTTLASTLGTDQAPAGLNVLRQLSAKGHIKARNLNAAGSHIDSFQTDIDLSGTPQNLRGAIHAAATEVNAADQFFDTINLSLGFAPQRELQLTARAVPHAAPERAFSAHIQAAYHADLAGIDLTGFELATRRAAWKLEPDAKLSARPTHLVFDQFTLRNGAQKIGAHGTFRLSGAQSLDVRIENFDLAALRYGFFLDSLLPRVAGQINLTANLRGTTRRPELSSVINARNIVVTQNGPFDAALKLDYRNEQLILSDLDLKAFKSSVVSGNATLPLIFDLTGKYSLPLHRPLNFSLNILESELAEFHPYLDVLAENKVTGIVSGSVHMSGTLDNPDLRANFDLENAQFIGILGEDMIDLREISSRTELTYTAPRNNQGGLTVNSNLALIDETIASLQLSTPLPIATWINEQVRGTGAGFQLTRALLQTPVRLALNVPKFDISNVPLQSFRDADASGIANIDINARGTFGNPQGNINIALENLGWQQFRNIDINLDANLLDHILNVAGLRLIWGNEELIAASGQLPIPFAALIQGQPIDDLAADFTIELRETLVSKLSAIDYTFARIKGSVAAFLRMQGTLRAPEITARAGIFNTELGDGRLGTIAAEIGGKDNTLKVNASLCREQQTVLLADATLPVLTDIIALSQRANPLIDGELNAIIKSDDMNLAQVLPTRLLENVVTDASGILDLDLELTGTWKAPVASGDIRLSDAAATLPAFARRVEQVQANISIDSERLTIQEISLRDGPSSATMKGEITHASLRPQNVKIDIETDDFNVGGFATDFPVYVRSKIAATGSLAGTDPSLDVNISNLNVIIADTQAAGALPTNLHEDIIILGDRSRRATRDPRDLASLATQTESTEGLLNLRVNIDVARDSWVRHSLGDVNLQAKVQAHLLGKTLILSGQGDALRGQFEFLGKRFVVQPSNVLFTGAVPPDPRLTIEATHPLDRAVVDAVGEPTTGEARIIFRITGTATQPILELSSDPPMTDSEILFVLVTGRPPDRSDAGQDEGVASQALSAVSGLFVGMLQDKLSGTMPIDVLKVEPGERGVGRIEVGKYITPDVFASIRREFGDEEVDASNIIRIEYHFLPRWMLEFVYSDRGDGELNMYWDVY